MCTEDCLRHAAAARTLPRRVALGGLAAAAGGVVLAPVAAVAAGRAVVGQRSAVVDGSPAVVGGRRRVHDLTHTFSPAFPTFAAGEEARRESYTTIADDGYYMQSWRLVEHTGTHVDAPVHFVEGGRTTTELTPDELLPPAVTVSMRRRVARDPDAELSVAELRAYEERVGKIPTGAAVLLHTGWDERVGSAERYRNRDAQGVMHFPGFGVDACEWLLTKRKIRALGIDTLSLDPGKSTDYPVHHMLLGADRYGLENLAGLGGLPPRDVTLIVGVVPWEQGSGGPARVLAQSTER